MIEIIYIFVNTIDINYLIHKDMARPFKHTAQTLELLFVEYKEWIKDQGYKVATVLKTGEVVYHTVGKPLSIESFCLFADIAVRTFYGYLSENEQDKEYMSVEELAERNELLQMSTRIREEIRDFQIGGATVNVFNANIVSRVNGLKEQQEIDVTGTRETINIVIDGTAVDLS